MRTIVAGVVVALLMFVGATSPAFAHETEDAAADTPFAGASGLENGAPNTPFAEADPGGAANALLRNPTCGAHFGPNGIHPPGNP